MKMGDGEEEYDDNVGEKWAKDYSSNHQILLVGDGDFSFSLSLARSFGSASNIVATSLDPYGNNLYIYIYVYVCVYIYSYFCACRFFAARKRRMSFSCLGDHV